MYTRSCGLWCAYCYEGARGRRVHRGHYGYRPPKPKNKEYWMSLQRRLETVNGIASHTRAPEADELSRKLPDLFDFLTVSKWPDGKERVPGTLMVLWEAGVFKGWLHDKDACLSLWFSCATFQELLVKANGFCGSKDGDWRTDTPRKGKR